MFLSIVNGFNSDTIDHINIDTINIYVKFIHIQNACVFNVNINN